MKTGDGWNHSANPSPKPNRGIWNHVALWWIAVAVISGTAANGQTAGAVQTAVDSIVFRDMQQHVNVLASDALEGREAGSRGGQAAGAYLVEQLRKIGMQPAGLNGEYFQPFGAPSNYRNILSVIPGSDPVLKDEYIVIGSHYDHVGYGTARNSRGPIGQIHNGADDNASGCATLLELMQAMKLPGVSSKRTLLFAFWDGEEKNLLGSKYFINVPTVPLSQIKLKINIDMVGRLTNQRLEVLGSRTVPGLRRFFSERNDQELEVDFNWNIIADSDHHPCVERGIPFLMPFTDKHDDYHRPSDDVDKLNFDGMQRIGRVTFRVLYDLANAPALPAFRQRCRVESEGTRRTLERPLARVQARLGVQTTRLDGDAVQISSVDLGSAAAAAGLLAGDRVVQFGGYDVTDTNFRAVVQVSQSPASILVQRGSETKSLQVTMPGQPRRLGIAWRTDASEPGTIMLSRVVAGSPAAMAGVRVGDRLYQLDGNAIESDEQFLAAIKGRTSLPVRIERKGRLFDTTIRPLAPPTK